MAECVRAPYYRINQLDHTEKTAFFMFWMNMTLKMGLEGKYNYFRVILI